jgi:hypothetical protein
MGSEFAAMEAAGQVICSEIGGKMNWVPAAKREKWVGKLIRREK